MEEAGVDSGCRGPELGFQKGNTKFNQISRKPEKDLKSQLVVLVLQSGSIKQNKRVQWHDVTNREAFEIQTAESMMEICFYVWFMYYFKGG